MYGREWRGAPACPLTALDDKKGKRDSLHDVRVWDPAGNHFELKTNKHCECIELTNTNFECIELTNGHFECIELTYNHIGCIELTNQHF